MYQEDVICDADLFPDNCPPQNQEKYLYPHEPKVLLLGTLGKEESESQVSLRNLSELEAPLKYTDDQGMLTYTKKVST